MSELVFDREDLIEAIRKFKSEYYEVMPGEERIFVAHPNWRETFSDIFTPDRTHLFGMRIIWQDIPYVPRR